MNRKLTSGQFELFDEQQSSPQLSKAQKRKKRKKARTPTRQPLEPLNETQAKYFDSLTDPEVTQIFAVGAAGTGKTYIPARFAIQSLMSSKISKIYLARPTVSSPRHQLGFLPGDMKKKLAPWLVPLLDAFKEEVSAHQLDQLMQQGKIEFISFEHLRGRTLSDCFLILDEAQNCCFADMKLMLTRKGENSIFVVAGDPSQADISDSGLDAIINIINTQDLSPDIIIFDENDVVRSVDAKEWVKAFSSM